MVCAAPVESEAAPGHGCKDDVPLRGTTISPPKASVRLLECSLAVTAAAIASRWS